MILYDLSETPGPTYGMSSSGAGAVHPLVEGEGELAGGPRGQGKAPSHWILLLPLSHRGLDFGMNTFFHYRIGSHIRRVR